MKTVRDNLPLEGEDAPPPRPEDEGRQETLQAQLVTLPDGAVVISSTILGRGAFGVVYLGDYQGLPVAVKEFNLAGIGVELDDAEALQAFEWEASRLGTLDHPNLVRFYGVCRNCRRGKSNLCMVMELCSSQNLADWLTGTASKLQAENEGPGCYDELDLTSVAKPEESDLDPAAADDNALKLQTHYRTYLSHVWANYNSSYQYKPNNTNSNKSPNNANPSNYKPNNPNKYNPNSSANPNPDPNPRHTNPNLNSNPNSGQSLGLPETPPLGWPTVWRVALDLAHGLAYLHDQGTLHRDLKSANVLIDFNGRSKLADLGVAQVDGLVQTSEATVLSRNLKDYGYAAPEEFTGITTAKSDMFSYGLVLCEMLQGRILDNRNNREAGRLEAIPSACLPSIREIIEKCWKVNPDERPTARDVIGLLERTACYTECRVSQWDSLLPRLEAELEAQQSALRQYVPSYVDEPENGEKGKEKNPSTIRTSLQQFLQDEKTNVLVVLGEGGFGKSLSTYDLAKQLLNERRQQLRQQQPDQQMVDDPLLPASWLPIFIRPAFPYWQHSALQDGLRQSLAYYGLHSDIPPEFSQPQRLVFILDGYDELSGNAVGNLPALLGLDKVPYVNAKLIISARPTSELMSALLERLSLKGVCIVQKLLPFTEDQRLQFLQNTLHWDGQQQQWFSDQLSRAPELAESLKNPFVLNIFAQSWETQMKQNFQRLTTHEIYETCIRHWVDTYAPLLPLSIHQQLFGDGGKSNALQSAKDWLIETAFLMAKNSTLSLPVSISAAPTVSAAWSSSQIATTLNEHASQQFQARMDVIAAKRHALSLTTSSQLNAENQANLTQELKSLERRALMSLPQYQSLLLSRAQRFLAQAPLKQRNGQLQFIHKSLWEYCTACGIHQALGHSTDQTEQALRLGLTPGFLLQDPAVLAFLQALTSPQDWTHWESWLTASKHNVDAVPVAACAITALNALQMTKGLQPTYEFPSNLSGIRIPGADLRGAMLDGVQFDGADLSQVQFTGGWLANASFAKARLAGVQFGEYPSLLLEELVFCCCYSADGRHFLVTQGEVIHLYEVRTQELLRKLKGHTSWVKSVAFSSDGAYIVSGAGSDTTDNDVRLWDAASGKLLWTLEGHTRNVTSVAFSPNGQHIASGSWDKSIRVWDRITGSLLRELKHTDWVNSVAFSPDGQYIISGNLDQSVKVWDLKSGMLLRELKGHTGWVNTVAFSPNGQYIVSGSRDLSMRIWDAENGAMLRELKGHTDSVSSVAFSPDGKYIASGSKDTLVRVWDAASGALLRELKGHSEEVTGVAFSPNGQSIASAGSKDKSVRLWEVASGALFPGRAGHTKSVTSIALSLNGKYIASGSLDNSIRMWDPSSGTSLLELKGHTKLVTCVAFSSDSRYIASGSRDKSVRMWDTTSGTSLRKLEGHTGVVNSVAISGSHIASGSEDKSIRLWSTSTGACVGQLMHAHHVFSVSFHPLGQSIASASWDKQIRVWSVRGSRLLRQVSTGHSDYAQSVVWSPNAKYMASRDKVSRGEELCIALWEFDGLSEVSSSLRHLKLQGEGSSITSGPVFSADSRYMAAAGKSLTRDVIGVWDVVSGKLIHLTHSGKPTTDLGWSAHGSFLATGHEDSSVRYWRIVGAGDNNMKLQLVWSSPRFPLMVQGLRIDDAQELSTTNASLLNQRGAIVGTESVLGEGKVVILHQEEPEEEQEVEQAPEPIKTTVKSKKCVLM